MFSSFTDWISPGLWAVLAILWLAPSIMALRWPGGAGAIVIVIGSVGNFICFLLSALDTYGELIVGTGFIDWESPLYVLHDIGFLGSFALQLAGFFMLVMRVKPMMQRLREFEALPPQG